jgi:hypothetical protein
MLDGTEEDITVALTPISAPVRVRERSLPWTPALLSTTLSAIASVKSMLRLLGSGLGFI